MTPKLSSPPLQQWTPQQLFLLKQTAKNNVTMTLNFIKSGHLVECFFNKLKHFRRCFSRFDKLARNYLSFLHFASTLIWLR